ncbi:unnamed protein product [Tetraodon nigroviridis]|uniref:(spotted green pufferfish) hypothetical protein n=1 Tax=Tetraodon nigroviridis TaxID=99883 RepID=Q4SGJ5_TETNG|nr:unnamed protein product [Tetraodon nigroviridis]
MLILVSLGVTLTALCLLGSVGALRENCVLLKVFSAVVLVLLAAQVLVAILTYTIHDQIGGYLRYYNCSAPGVLACGVPASCCVDPLQNGTVWNSLCGVGAQALDEFTAQTVIYLGGCLGGISRQTLKGRGKPKKAEPDHLQHIPFKLREIMKSKDRMKKALLKPKKPKKGEKSSPLPFPCIFSVGVGLTGVSPVVPSGDPCDGEIPVPHFQRGRRESEKAFVRRMENETKHVLFLTRNQVDRKPEQDGDEKPSSKSKSEKKKTYDSFKLQRLQQKKYERQEARLEKQMFVASNSPRSKLPRRFKSVCVVDDVPFGEVVLAPPSLSSKPKNAQVKSQKDSGTLLLHSLLGHSVTSTNKPSMARQRMMEEERERAVQAYRCLKKQRQEQHEARAANLKKLMDLH